jgi:hypothetical protein
MRRKRQLKGKTCTQQKLKVNKRRNRSGSGFFASETRQVRGSVKDQQSRRTDSKDNPDAT